MNYISSTNNQTLMSQAHESLRGKWGIASGAWLVFFILTNLGNFGWDSLGIVSLIIGGPLSLGYVTIILLISRNQDPDFKLLFSGFKRFGVTLTAYLLMIIFILLWTLLLIIPGIIACIRYSQAFYILSEDENISPLEAISKSKEMMIDNKWKLFCLYCRFIGWFMLCIVTLGFAGLYVGPYFSVSNAKFYDDLKNDYAANKIETSSEDIEIISNDLPENNEANNNTGEQDKDGES